MTTRRRAFSLVLVHVAQFLARLVEAFYETRQLIEHRKLSCLCRGMLWLLTLFVAPNVLAQDAPEPAAILGRINKLQSWSAHYEIRMATDFDPSIVPPSGIKNSNFVEERAVTFTFVRGSAKLESEVLNLEEMRAASQYPSLRKAEVVTSERVEEMSWSPRATYGTIKHAGSGMSEDWTFDVALGVRLFGKADWDIQRELANAKVEADAQGALVTILDPSGIEYKLRYLREFEFALGSLRMSIHGGLMLEEIQCSDFRRVGDVFVPFKIVRFNTYRDTSGATRQPFTRTIIVKELKIPAAEQTKDELLITWPAGSVLLDARTGLNIPVGPTSRPMTDAAIAKEIEKQQ